LKKQFEIRDSRLGCRIGERQRFWLMDNRIMQLFLLMEDLQGSRHDDSGVRRCEVPEVLQFRDCLKTPHGAGFQTASSLPPSLGPLSIGTVSDWHP
jgi:hypothetical protein